MYAKDQGFGFMSHLKQEIQASQYPSLPCWDPGLEQSQREESCWSLKNTASSKTIYLIINKERSQLTHTLNSLIYMSLSKLSKKSLAVSP